MFDYLDSSEFDNKFPALQVHQQEVQSKALSPIEEPLPPMKEDERTNNSPVIEAPRSVSPEAAEEQIQEVDPE